VHATANVQKDASTRQNNDSITQTGDPEETGQKKEAMHGGRAKEDAEGAVVD
jgi:hypothetical protein